MTQGLDATKTPIFPLLEVSTIENTIGFRTSELGFQVWKLEGPDMEYSSVATLLKVHEFFKICRSPGMH
jgi:hypothetical protein